MSSSGTEKTGSSSRSLELSGTDLEKGKDYVEIEKVRFNYFDAEKKLYKFSSALFMGPGEGFEVYRQGDYIGFEKDASEYMGFFKYPRNSETPVDAKGLEEIYKSFYQDGSFGGKNVIYAEKEGRPVIIYEGEGEKEGKKVYFKNYITANGREVYIITSVAGSLNRADANLNKFVNSLSFTQ